MHYNHIEYEREIVVRFLNEEGEFVTYGDLTYVYMHFVAPTSALDIAWGPRHLRERTTVSHCEWRAVSDCDADII